MAMGNGRWPLVTLLAVLLATALPIRTVAAGEGTAFIAGQRLTTEPKHVRLAFRAERPTPLLDVPSTFWTVQLVALSSKEALEEYARAHQLGGMSAARIAHRGALFYALLLGVYETKEIAEEATTELPAPLDQLGVWVRSLGSLQQAIRDGNKLAGGTDF